MSVYAWAWMWWPAPPNVTVLHLSLTFFKEFACFLVINIKWLVLGHQHSKEPDTKAQRNNKSLHRLGIDTKQSDPLNINLKSYKTFFVTLSLHMAPHTAKWQKKAQQSIPYNLNKKWLTLIYTFCFE